MNLTTQKELSEILVFEDGVLGVQACANTNGMNCIWVPDPEMLKIDHSKNDLKFVEQLSSIEEFKPELYGLPSYEI